MKERINRNSTYRQHDDWDEVHQQMIEVQQQNAIQKKSLTVSDPGDEEEKEADEIARKVSDNEIGEVGGINQVINRKGEGRAEASTDFQSELESSKGNGQPLPENVQQEMGSKMGADFSNVKVHTGSNAHAMNEEVNARAFAHGNDVYFKQGEYNPASIQEKELLAHELVHTVQQGNSGVNQSIQRQDGKGGGAAKAATKGAAQGAETLALLTSVASVKSKIVPAAEGAARNQWIQVENRYKERNK